MDELQPTISLITTCKGRLTFLRQTLPRMVDQGERSEVIVVDYDCPDGTAAWVESNHARVHVVKVEDAPIFNAAKARNRGAAVAQGQWLAFVDADVLVARTFVDQLVPQLRAGHFYRPLHRAPDVVGTFVCARSDFVEIGGYDEAIHGWGGEDRDMYDRLTGLLGRKRVGFPAQWVSPLEHSDAERVRFAELADKALSQRANALYRWVKFDLIRLSGSSPLPLPLRERLHSHVRRAVVDAAAKGLATATVDIDASDAPGVTLPAKCSVVRKLRYELRWPAARPNDALLDSGLPGQAAQLRRAGGRGPTPIAARTAGAIDGLRYLKRTPLTAGMTLFAMLRNESYLLPHFLHHYRRLGVENFVFYDDHSTDGTLDLLDRQPSCSVLTSERDEREIMREGSTLQLHAKSTIPESLGAGRWVLTVDIDEFLVLPPSYVSLTELCADLDAWRYRCVLACIVDFYPARLADRNYSREMSPFAGSPYFDVERRFERSMQSPRPTASVTGVCARLLSMLKERNPAVCKRLLEERRFKLDPPWKVPLIKTGFGVALRTAHDVNVVPPFDVELALAHFMFGPDLDQRIASSLGGGKVPRGCIESEFLEATIEFLPAAALVYSGSRRYSEPKDLEQTGFTFVNRGRAVDDGPDPRA